MPKEEWGVKRVCPTTGKRFYDLNKSPIVSPYTNEVVAEDIVLEEDTDDVEVDLADDILEDDEEDTVPLEEIADISSEEES